MTVATPQTEAELYLQLSQDGGERLLHAARVIEVDDARRTVEILDATEGIGEAAWTIAYFHLEGEFVKQSAQIVECHRDEGLVMVVELMGEPVTAEQRQHFRVSCVGSALTADLPGAAGCEVVDVSATGFGLYSTLDLRPGEILVATVHHAGVSYRGHVAVQSIRPLPSRLIRYGVRAVDTDPGDAALIRGLPKVSAAVQREQLRRLS